MLKMYSGVPNNRESLRLHHHVHVVRLCVDFSLVAWPSHASQCFTLIFHIKR